MKNRVAILALIAISSICCSVFAEMVEDTSAFNFDRRVDNGYLGNYTFGGPSNYFSFFYAIDTNYYEAGGYYYGVGTDCFMNCAYYFDENTRVKFFAMNSDNKARALQTVGKVAVTKSGRIYIADMFADTVSYWNVNGGTYSPQGKLSQKFVNVRDIFCDQSDNLFILDEVVQRVYVYSTATGTFKNFTQTGKNYISYKDYSRFPWGVGKGIVVSANFIYVIFEFGAIIKLDADGAFIKRYEIDFPNLGLQRAFDKSHSQTFLESIAADRFGNIYVLDTKAKRIHIFSGDLEYKASWHDPSRPIEASTSDISFMPGQEYFYISNPWGFYSYRLKPTVSGIKLDRDFIYPELVCDNYKGIAVSLSTIGSGNLDVILSKSGWETKIVDHEALASNSSFSFTWNGKTKDGNNVPYGSYSMRFFLDGNLCTIIPINIKKAPEISLSGEDNVVFNGEKKEAEYTYQITGDGYLKVCIAPVRDYYDAAPAWEKIINEGNRGTGSYSQLVTPEIGTEELSDGYYNANFYLLPAELKDLNIESAMKYKQFIVDNHPLDVGSLVNKTAGFNPLNSAMDKMEASIDLSEGVFGTLDVIRGDGSTVTNIFTHSYLESGSRTLNWSGYSAAGELVKDGNYRIRLLVEQDFIGSPFFRESEYFALDKTPPAIRMAHEGAAYYISPDEPSSIGIKDSCTLDFTFNENALSSIVVYDVKGQTVKTLKASYRLTGGETGSVSWDGKNESNNFVPDGKYAVKIIPIDDFGNTASYQVPVFVDNNRMTETAGEVLFSSEETRVSPTIPTYGISNQSPSISRVNMIDDGFVVVWFSMDNGSGYPGIYNVYAQILDRNLNKARSVIKVNSSESQVQDYPIVAKIKNGFIVAWEYYRMNGDDLLSIDVHAQRFNNAGDKMGGEFTVNSVSGTGYWQNSPVVSETENGFAVVWNVYKFDDNGFDIYKRLYDSQGVPLGAETRINSIVPGDQRSPSIAKSSDGFIVTWESNINYIQYSVRAQRFNNSFVPVGSEIAVSEIVSSEVCSPVIAPMTAGFIIVWSSKSASSTGIDVHERIFDSNGNPMGHEQTVNTATAYDQLYPSIAQTDGGFVIAWHSMYQVMSGMGVFARMFDSSGTAKGSEFKVNNFDNSYQFAPVVSEAEDGFVIAWQSSYQGDSGTSIFAKKYGSYMIPAGGNLAADIVSPSADPFITGSSFPVMGIASDSNIEKYTLSIVSPANTEIIEMKEGANVTGEISFFNILSCERSVEYTIELEAWDKAGNYREDHFICERSGESQSLVESFKIDKKFNSTSHPPLVTYKLSDTSEVSLSINNQYDIMVKSINLGTQDSSVKDYILDISGIADGEYTLHLFAANPQKGNVESIVKFIIDNTPPRTAINYFGYYFSNQININIPATVIELYVKQISLDLNDSHNNFVKTICRTSTPSDLDNVAFDPLSLSEGSYKFVLIADDLSNNSSSYVYNIYIDRSAPVITLSTPDFSSVLHGIVPMNGTISDVTDVASYTVSLIMPHLSETLLYSGTGSTIDFDWQSGSVLPKAFEAALEFTAIDRGGNESLVRKPIVVDNNPPEVSLAFDSAPVFVGNRSFVNAQDKLYLNGVSGDRYSVVDGIFYNVNNTGWSRYVAPLGFTTEGDYSILYYGTDNVGNVSAVKETIFTVDASAPSFSLSIDDPKYVKDDNIFVPLSNNIRIDASDGSSQFSSGVAAVMLKVDDGVWETYAGSGIKIYSEGPHSVLVRVSDFAGNSTERTEGPIVVDIAPPSTKVSADCAIYYSIQRNIIALGGSGLLALSAMDFGLNNYFSGVKGIEYTLDGVTNQYTEPILFEEGTIHTLQFRATDNVGNIEQRMPVTIAIDTAPPVVSLTASKFVFTVNNVVYSNTGNSFGFTASDDFAGVKAVYYKLGNGEYTEYEENFTLNVEADVLLQYHALDYLDHDSGVKSQRLVIDTTPPDTGITTNIPLVESGGVLYADSRYLFTWTAVDTGSGVSSTHITIDGTALAPGVLQYTFMQSGNHSIEYYSTDNVGNIEAIKTLYVTTPIPDTTPPVTSIVPSYPAYNNGRMDFFKNDVTFTVTATDVIGEHDSYASGVDKSYLAVDGGVETIYTGEAIPVSFEGLHEILFHSVDKAGNAETWKRYFFTTDVTPPVSIIKIADSHLTINGVVWLSASGRIGIESSDSSSGVKSVFYKLDGDSQWIAYEKEILLPAGKHTIEYYASDNLSNTEDIKSLKVSIVADYNIVSYMTAMTQKKPDTIVEYDIADNTMAYLKGSRDHNDIYIKGIRNGSFKNMRERKLSASKEKRADISIAGNYIATSEERRDGSDVYLYNLREVRQRGLKLSVTGKNTQPIVIDKDVYWVNEENGLYSIYDYSIGLAVYNGITISEGSIKLSRTNDNRLSFIVRNRFSDEIYVLEGGQAKRVFEKNITVDNDRIANHSMYGNILAVEEIESGKHSIRIFESGTDLIPIGDVSGAMPVMLDAMTLLYVEKKNEYDVLEYYNLLNSVKTGILKGDEITSVMIDSGMDLFIERNIREATEKHGPQFGDQNRGTDSSHENRGKDKVEKQFVYLKDMKAADLLDDIEYSSENTSFAYNKYFDREDFLYADDDTVFTGILNVVGGIHQVQTFKNEQAGSGEELVNLRAKKNIRVFVLRVREKDRYGEHTQWEKQFGFFGGNFKDYSIESYDVKAGEVLSVKGIGKGDASLLIFVREKFVKNRQ